jgi:hypothetical protein
VSVAVQAKQAVPDRVAYIVLSHQNPRQILRLVDRLVRSDPAGEVVVNHDAALGALDLCDYSEHPRVHVQQSSSRRRWGSYTLAKDLLDAVSWVVAHLDVDWLTVLSGQDYPLRSLASFGSELAASGYDAFLSGVPIPSDRPPPSDSGALYSHARYHFRWYELPRWVLGWARGDRSIRLLGSAQRRLSSAQPFIFLWTLPAGGGDMIGFRRRKLPFGSDFQCYKGSQWLTFSRKAAQAMTGFIETRPDVMRLYERSLIADESLPVTILSNDADLRVQHPSHHYIRMTGAGDSHAAVLGVGDLELLLASGNWFARKFDDRVDSEVLDRLDAEVLSAP